MYRTGKSAATSAVLSSGGALSTTMISQRLLSIEERHVRHRRRSSGRPRVQIMTVRDFVRTGLDGLAPAGDKATVFKTSARSSEPSCAQAVFHNVEDCMVPLDSGRLIRPIGRP